MSNFNTELKLEYLDDFIYRADFYEKDIAGLKAETMLHYKKIMNKSSSITSKIVGELMTMWGDTTTPHKAALRNIALTYAKSVSFKLPLEIHRAALILAFPLIREIVGIITKYGNNLFTPGMVAGDIKGEYGSEVTIAEAIPKALLTMFNLGMLKRDKRGVYRTNCWPVYNAFGILATLTAAQAMADSEHPKNNLAMRGVALELNHEFVDCFTDFDYASIVGNELWEAFKTSIPNHSLQYDGNTWILSDKEFVYPCYKTPLSGIPTRFRLSATEAVQMTVEDQK